MRVIKNGSDVTLVKHIPLLAITRRRIFLLAKCLPDVPSFHTPTELEYSLASFSLAQLELAMTRGTAGALTICACLFTAVDGTHLRKVCVNLTKPITR